MSAPGALAMAAAVRSGRRQATAILEGTLERIAKVDPDLNCFTAVLAERARREAARVDALVEQGRDPGPLAGVPYAVKNLYDIAGTTTLAGSRLRREAAPAESDATVVQRLGAAGAVLVGALNMDEFAYGFTTENSHYGPTRNPHDATRVAGGSSGGSAAAVAAGLVPLTLGTDTNGSIRVPAALCGVFGLKPTFGRLSRAGVFPFAASLDHAGPLAGSVVDLAAAYDAMQGADARDPVCRPPGQEAVSGALVRGAEDLRIAVAAGHFAEGGAAEAAAALERAAAALGATRRLVLPEAGRARAAAAVITTTEAGNLHLADLRQRADAFDPLIRDRLLAGAMVPATWYLQAQRFRRWFRQQVSRVFEQVDVLLAPATPCMAPRIGQERMTIAGREVLMRPYLGLYTQPISFVGLPVVAAPVTGLAPLPVGVQVIAAPWQEANALRVAAELERAGVARAVAPAVGDRADASNQRS